MESRPSIRTTRSKLSYHPNHFCGVLYANNVCRTLQQTQAAPLPLPDIDSAALPLKSRTDAYNHDHNARGHFRYVYNLYLDEFPRQECIKPHSRPTAAMVQVDMTQLLRPVVTALRY